MRDVKATDAGQKEFAAYGRHGVIEVHLHTRVAEYLRRHQTGGAATNNGDVPMP